MTTIADDMLPVASCIAADCRRGLAPNAMRMSPSVILPEDEFCRWCARPRDAEAAIFITPKWARILRRLRLRESEARPAARRGRPYHLGVGIGRRFRARPQRARAESTHE